MLKKILIFSFFLVLTLNATIPTNENVTKLYVATFNRAPDTAGLSYWVNDSKLDLEGIAQSFFDQSETQILYPNSLSTSSFIISVYLNLFNRTPDEDGLAYWLDEIDSGKIIRSVFIQAVIDGALNTDISNDETILNNKTDVGLYFATQGQTDIDQAFIVVEDITDNTNSVNAAISYINTLNSNSLTDVYSNVALVAHNKSTIPILIVLVNYNNISVTSNEVVWASKIFGESEHELNHYFNEVSNSKFKFAQAVENSGILNNGIASVSLNKNHPNIDIDSSIYSMLVYSDLKNALENLNSKIDFSNYDNDANGFISEDELLITFIMAGYEDSYEGSHVTNGTWGHQSCLSSSLSPTLDGVSLLNCNRDGKFAIFGERHDINNPHDATIGIIAHELGHAAFNLPDLYNISGSTGGIGNFGVMGGGTWATQNFSEFAGNTPVHFSAWSKVYMDWVTPTEGNGSESLYESSSADYNVIKVSINENEYYLLENRNNRGYDKGLFSLNGTFNGGMAMWHINKNKLTDDDIFNNNVNSITSDKGVDLVEATNATIDTVSLTSGHEKALFYSPSITSFENVFSDVSDRGTTMTLNID